VFWIEAANELIDFEGSFPNIPEKLASWATAVDDWLTVDGGVVLFMSAATAFKLTGADLQMDPEPTTLTKLRAGEN
jgi:hypothetical protein